MAQLVYPTNYEIMEISAELVADDNRGRHAFEIAPEVNSDAFEVRWVQEDSAYGLQQFRGLGGEPASVDRVAMKEYSYTPFVYGEFAVINEAEITRRMSYAAFLGQAAIGTRIDMTDEMLRVNKQLIGRQQARKRYNIWNTVLNGQITVSKPGPTGAVIADVNAYTPRTVTAGVPFTSLASSSPIATLQQIKQLGVGLSLDLGSGAKIYGNSASMNYIINNQNPNDYGGKRNAYGATLNNVAGANDFFKGQGLGQLVEEDDGYYPTQVASMTPGPASFTKFLPNGTFLIVGKRLDGGPVAQYKNCFNVNANDGLGGPGDYFFVKDFARGINAAREPNARVEAHRGHSGGACVLYPSAIIVLKTGAFA